MKANYLPTNAVSFTSRRLTSQEIAAVPYFILVALDMKSVRIHNQPWTPLTPRNITVARGYNIFWPDAPLEAKSLSQMAHIIHEVVHVWQYMYLDIGFYSWRWLDRRYQYDLHRVQRFLDLGLEQQASFLEDRYLIQNGVKPRHAKSLWPSDEYDKILKTEFISQKKRPPDM